ncbi:PucR family transcriptional regulator [Streptacidiphilus sp. MAP5-3]|uniref:PucR family transcriptional regulator n=1 Tax=unclassified Streptacidiphilus TaxID=2643834 RepID=UPI003511C770
MTLADRTKTADEAVTLGTLVDAVGPTAVSVLVAPRGLDVPVRAISLHDCADQLALPEANGTVLLAVGAQVDGPELLDLFQRASTSGCCAVVLKLRAGSSAAAVAAAGGLGLALLAAPDAMPWRDLDAALASALATQGLTMLTTVDPRDDLFAIANTIAVALGGSVAIEDLGQRILAYSSVPGQRVDEIRERGILDRRVPDDDVGQPAQYRAVLAASGVVRFPQHGEELPRAAVAVRAGALPLGTIWAIEAPAGVDPDGEQLLLDGARIAARHLLSASDAEDRSRHMRNQTLRALLDTSRTAPDAAERLGLPRRSSITLTGFTFTGADQPGPSVVCHLGTALRQWYAAFHPRATITTTEVAAYALVPGDDPAATVRLAARALQSVRRVFATPVRAAVSAPGSKPGDIAAMREEIDEILRVLATAPQRSFDGGVDVATVEDVHSRLVLSRFGSLLAQDPRLRHPGVNRVLEYDRTHRTDYAATLLAWLDAVGDIADAARNLRLHPNSIRYRLRRAEELFSLDLADPDTRLSVWLQLRLTSRRTTESGSVNR